MRGTPTDRVVACHDQIVIFGLQPVTIIVPYTAGGAADVLARLLIIRSLHIVIEGGPPRRAGRNEARRAPRRWRRSARTPAAAHTAGRKDAGSAAPPIECGSDDDQLWRISEKNDRLEVLEYVVFEFKHRGIHDVGR